MRMVENYSTIHFISDFHTPQASAISFSLSLSLSHTHTSNLTDYDRGMDAEWTKCRATRSPIGWPRFHFGETHLNTDGRGLFSCHNRGHSRPHSASTTHTPFSILDLLSRRFSVSRNTARPMLFRTRDGQ